MTRRKRDRRRAGPTLKVPTPLLEAVTQIFGAPLIRPDSIAALAKGVQALSAGLTVDREAFIKDRYLAQRALRRAYATYYLCANAPKAWPLLDTLARMGALPDDRLKVIELGCGPGTGVAATGLWARERGLRWQHLATDFVPANLKDTQALARALNLDGVSVAKADANRPDALGSDHDLALLMNVVNELPTSADLGLEQALRGALTASGVLLVIEPAAREPSRRALQFRDHLRAAGWQILAPCPSSAPCPALVDARDWCHGEWPFERPAFMKAIDARVGTRREVLKATWFAATPSPRPVAQPVTQPSEGPSEELTAARAVSAREDLKGRSRIQICDGDQLRWIELQRRDRTPLNEALSRASRHDRILFSNAIPKGDCWRLGPDSRCSLPDVD